MGANAERMAGQGRMNRRGGKERYPITLSVGGDTGLTQQYERQQDREAVSRFNRRVRAWGRDTNAALKSSIGRLVRRDTRLSSSVRQNYRHWGRAPQAGQEITSIGCAFEEAGLYVHLGVGRGYNREGGTVVVTKKHNRDRMARRPKPWFDPVIEDRLPALEKVVQDYCGDLFINTGRILTGR